MSGLEPSVDWTPLRARVAFWAILLFAAVVRLAHLAAVFDAPFVRQLALDSQEYDRWAREIVAGDWLGSAPFFQAPLYPYLVAALYALFAAAPVTVHLAQIAAAIAGCAALMACGRRFGGPALGLVTGAFFALYQPFWFHDVQLLKESFATSGVCLLLLLLAEARHSDSGRLWLGAGAVAGGVALLRENMLLVVPFLLPLAWMRGSPGKRRLARAALFLCGVALPLLPVAARNAALAAGAETFLPTTSQGGVNFWIGNNPQADGTYRPLVPGKQIPAYEREEARRLAERAMGRNLAAGEVSRYWLGRALAWARQHPADFLRLEWRKLRLYWSGYEWPDAVDYYWMKSISPPLGWPGLEFMATAILALAGAVLVRRELGLWSPVWLFELGWMVTTVAFFLFSRYRLPAVPGLLLLAAVPVVRTGALWRAGRRGTALAASALVAAVWAAPHLAGYEPRVDLVEFNLGRLAEERGDGEAAANHYERALAADPRHLSATLNLGNLAARAGDYPRALKRFEAAVEIAPDSDDAQANLGGARLALGDFEGARRALARALELNPENCFARHNLGLLERHGSER